MLLISGAFGLFAVKSLFEHFGVWVLSWSAQTEEGASLGLDLVILLLFFLALYTRRWATEDWRSWATRKSKMRDWVPQLNDVPFGNRDSSLRGVLLDFYQIQRERSIRLSSGLVVKVFFWSSKRVEKKDWSDWPKLSKRSRPRWSQSKETSMTNPKSTTMVVTTINRFLTRSSTNRNWLDGLPAVTFDWVAKQELGHTTTIRAKYIR